MLVRLRVRDLILIDELDVELSPRFNVLTGETGAGKSLVAVAMDLLLGRRARGELVRRGSKEAEVEGLFDISDEPEVRARLDQAGLLAGEELLIRRVIPVEGRHRCHINGRMASLGLLQELSDGLASVTSQHEHHSLVDPGSQLGMLDAFGGLTSRTGRMEALYRAVEEKRAALEELRNREQDRASRLDYLEFQLAEIDKIAPRPGELDELDIEIARLRHQEQLVGTSRQAAEELYEGDGAMFERLGSLTQKLEEAARYDSSLSGSAEELREAAAVIEDAARFLSAYGNKLESDPARLAELEDRREELIGLTRKHGLDLDGVIDARRHIADEIDTLGRYQEALGEAEEALARRTEEAMEHAASLSRARKKAGRALSKAVTGELADLKFKKADFEVRVEPGPRGLTAQGIDAVELLVALNPGEGAHRLRKVASGGELSRLMLAIKRALAGVGPVGTYIFDEVDAGIGGQAAASVGRKLKEVAEHHQVICITHLPQIAGMADAHLMVSKKAEKGRTTTRVHPLSPDERVEELARMLGGEKVTKKTRAAAEELLG